MTRDEFSNQFDVLVASYRRFRDFDNKEPLDTVEFNEYEKSLYITKAQEELVISLYNGKNPYKESFEQTEEMRRYLAPLVEEVVLEPIETSDGKPLGIESTSKFFTLPDNLWFITYEAVRVSQGKCEENATMDVYPVRENEYHKIKRNPFRGANNRRALRLDLSEGIVEIICKYDVTNYCLKYLRKVNPVVLTDLPEGLTIEGRREAQECELPEILHQMILEDAVTMALQSKGYSIKNNENR